MVQIHNAIKYGTDITRAFSRAIGLGEDEEGTVRLGETLTPVLDLWGRPEWAFLRGEVPFSATVTIAAGAVNTFGKTGIFNPAGSGLLCVATHHLLVPAAQASITLQVSGAPLATTTTIPRRDRRSTEVAPGILLQSEASAGLTTVIFSLLAWTGANVPPFELPIILPPGQGFFWASGDDAAILNYSVTGYVRRLQPSEL